MPEPQIHEGRFWVADDPCGQADGKVIIDADGRVTLITDGFFRDQNDDQDDGLFNEIAFRDGTRLIEGQTVSDHVKLIGCFVKAQRGGMLGTLNSIFPTVEWHCNKAYIGADYPGDEPTAIRSVEIVIPAYDEWVSGFPEIVWSRDGEMETMAYPSNPTEKTARWSLGTLTISQKIMRTNAEFMRYGTKTATVTTSVGLIVEFEESQPVSIVGQIVTALQALVSIAQGEACDRLSTRVYENQNVSEGIQVWSQPILHSTGQHTRYGQMFSFEEIGNAEGVARWLDYATEKPQLWIPLLVDMYRQPTFITDRTGHLLIACETLIRSRSTCPGENLSGLVKKILMPLITYAGKEFVEWVADSRSWADHINKIRNDFGVAHFQAYADQSSFAPNFRTANEQIYTLLILNVLRELGINNETVEKVITRADMPMPARI